MPAFTSQDWIMPPRCASPSGSPRSSCRMPNSADDITVGTSESSRHTPCAVLQPTAHGVCLLLWSPLGSLGGLLGGRQVPPAGPGPRLLDDLQEQFFERRRRVADRLQLPAVLPEHGL